MQWWCKKGSNIIRCNLGVESALPLCQRARLDAAGERVARLDDGEAARRLAQPLQG